jgi:membrane protein implicated in regulation of membrane protease activity
MEWWLWVILGFLMMVAELLTPGGFYLLFFGVGAVIVGSLDALGWAGPAWTQWLLFSLLSVVCLLVFRRPLRRDSNPPPPERRWTP